MPMIWKANPTGFVDAMNAAFEAAYKAAARPLIANDPGVIAARVTAEAAQAEVLKGIRAADGYGFFQTMKAGPGLSRLAYEASVAERQLRKAIDQALARKMEERDEATKTAQRMYLESLPPDQRARVEQFGARSLAA
jgi:hypothetical protein